MLKFALLVLCLAVALDAKKNCFTDDECYDLGDLVCIKSYCDRGVCSCPRGRAAKYMGSTSLYKCVPIKKIGQSCSNSGSTGVCGPIDSYCNETTKKCTCDPGKVPKAGGEICVNPDEQLIGETCSPGGIGNDCIDSECRSEEDSGDYWLEDNNFNMPTCACREDENMFLTNTIYGTDSAFFHESPGSKEPVCLPKQVGDACVDDNDCPTRGNSVECVNKVCVCKTATHVKDYYGTSCNVAIGKGANCTFVTGHCNGAQGLICGDQFNCDIYDEEPFKCICGPHHSDNGGSSCTEIGAGGSCYGDFNCKLWKLTAVCTDGTCVDGSATVAATLLSVLLPILVKLLQS